MLVELLAQLLGGQAVERLRGELLDALEVAADRRVDREQSLVRRAATDRLGLRLERWSCARAAATRSRTCGATSSMNVRSVSGSGGATRSEGAEAEVQREVRQHVRPVVGRPDDRLVGVAGRRRAPPR